MPNRVNDINRFYEILDELASRVGGTQKLKNCDGYMDWPNRGLYFFLEPGEYRSGNSQRRVTRIGTHAVSAGSQTSLWNRLKGHMGTGNGSSGHPHGGAHRGSVYRKRVGESIIAKHDLHDDYPDWDKRWSSITRTRAEVRDEEYILERRVSAYIRDQPFLWVNIDDEPSPESNRAYIERNTIALLSNFESPPIDPRREDWLGGYSKSQEICESGLWNVNHVAESYDPSFLDMLAEAVTETTPV